MNNNTNKILEEMISTPEGLDKLIEMMEQYKERNKKEIATNQQEDDKIIFDYTKLLKRINEKYNNSISDFNKDIEWDEGDIFKKLHGFSYFTMDEIDRVIKALEIDNMEELKEYFFTKKTDKKEVDSKSLLKVSDELFNLITDLEIMIEVDKRIKDSGADERLAETITWDYLNKAKDRAVETYELLNEIGNIK
jgi:hypothetical protein